MEYFTVRWVEQHSKQIESETEEDAIEEVKCMIEKKESEERKYLLEKSKVGETFNGFDHWDCD